MIHGLSVRLGDWARVPPALLAETAGLDRGIGVAKILHGHAPAVVIVLFAIITQLGDLWFLFLLGGGVYIAGVYIPHRRIERPQGLFVLGLVALYTTLSRALKGWFMLPRPPGASDPPTLNGIPLILSGVVTRISTAGGIGTGFPSGHALGTTLVWGGLALTLDGDTTRRHLALAGVVVLLVSVSRLVLGVHYVVDVLAGAGIGIVVLGVLYRVTDHGAEPGPVLFGAVIFGVIAVLVDLTVASVAAFGGALGGWLTWTMLADTIPARPSSRLDALLGVVGIGVAGAALSGVYLVTGSVLVAFLGTAISGSVVVAAPRVGDRLSSASSHR